MSEAMRLADELQGVIKWSDSQHWDTLEEAAAELRRLHALNTELVEALRMSRDALNQMWQSDKARPALVVAERALAKVGENNGS